MFQSRIQLQIVDPRLVFPADQADDLEVVCFLGLKIGFAQIDVEDGQIAGIAKEMLIGFLDGLEVGGGNVLFVGSGPVLDIVDQLIDAPVQVDQQIGLWEGSVENVKKPLEEPVLFGVEVVFCKEKGFYKVVIRNYGFLEEVFLDQVFLELLVAFGQEKELNRKGISIGVFVEKGEEGIIGKFFQDEAALKVPFQHFAQGGFSGADVSFDGDKLMWERLNHRSDFFLQH